ncbi:hypothetical protein Syun_003488 [Stephania yunnanensis]|uniref:Uncharacterized protein n=1 Tax=Stephania yunnanensis TaxID=152371 RepID=A0AAP0L1I8_9MAGN
MTPKFHYYCVSSGINRSDNAPPRRFSTAPLLHLVHRAAVVAAPPAAVVPPSRASSPLPLPLLLPLRRDPCCYGTAPPRRRQGRCSSPATAGPLHHGPCRCLHVIRCYARLAIRSFASTAAAPLVCALFSASPSRRSYDEPRQGRLRRFRLNRRACRSLYA